MSDLQHKNPIWKEKANFVGAAIITDSTWSKEYSHEQLAFRDLQNDEYELCSIPFAIYDLFLGDICKLNDQLEISQIIRRSGRTGFRVKLNDIELSETIRQTIREAHGNIEDFSLEYFCIDVEDEIKARYLADKLQQMENDSLIWYETLSQTT